MCAGNKNPRGKINPIWCDSNKEGEPIIGGEGKSWFPLQLVSFFVCICQGDKRGNFLGRNLVVKSGKLPWFRFWGKGGGTLV